MSVQFWEQDALECVGVADGQLIDACQPVFVEGQDLLHVVQLKLQECKSLIKRFVDFERQEWNCQFCVFLPVNVNVGFHNGRHNRRVIDHLKKSP